MLLWFRLGAVGLVGVVGVLFWLHYQNLRAEAAKVPELEKAIQAERDLAQSNLESYLTQEYARQQAQAELMDWERVKNDVVAAVRREMRNSQVATNPVCAPTDAERELYNSAIRDLTRTGTEPRVVMP